MVKKTTAEVASKGYVIRDSKSGQFITVRGAGALKDSKFRISPSFDLTKPIASQASRKGGSHRTPKG